MGSLLRTLCILALFVAYCHAHNKYSAHANEGDKPVKPAKPVKPSKKDLVPPKGSMFGETSDFRKLEKPFRMAKLNMLWSKAQVVSTSLLFVLLTYLRFIQLQFTLAICETTYFAETDGAKAEISLQ